MSGLSEPITQRADAEHPWVGLASFTECDRQFFAGRGDEIEDLVRLVQRDNITLLYGVSGLGKTSLLQAGVFPTLRENNYLPVPIRLDHLEGAAPLAKQVLDAIAAAAKDAEVEAPQPRPGDTLWEYFHREDNHFWSRRNDLVTPFLVFDQFEEFFTLGRDTPDRIAQAKEFITQLADLVENRPPATMRDDPSRAKGFNFKPVPVKVLLSMREDYLAELDRIRTDFRALGQNRLRLLPMGERQARQVIELGAPLLASGVEDRIVKYVAGPVASSNGADLTIAPALLSLVLRELNERRLALGPGAKITPDLLDVEQHKIFEDFYLRTLGEFPENVRTFIEDQLLTATGHRSSCALDDALTRPNVTLPIVNELVNRRLLAYEDRHGTRRVELTHDVLVPVIKTSRDNRITREALAQAERLRAEQDAQRRKQHITTAIAFALAIALVATIWGGYYFFLQEHRAYYRSFAKQNGFPVGIGPISRSEVSKVNCSLRLTYKGIKWGGWRFWKSQWKPAFRMEAVDGQLQPTINHSIRTYLWKGESESGDTSQKAEHLGLNKVCKWEFVPNANGEIMYERGLDRDNRMVFGLIYSPLASGSKNTRLARFVGPDGFPQLQGSSAAEYVSLEYDSDGWESRIMYRDGKNHPAMGPDGAYGQHFGYNHDGQRTLILSLDAVGKNMIDSSGNCGLRISYDQQGLTKEEHSIGPDMEPMPVKGWIVAKIERDHFGRTSSVSYYGLRDEPVLNQETGEGCHSWKYQYDEHGNVTEGAAFGLDGKPMLLPPGYAIYKSEYDERGNLIVRRFYGLKGQPVFCKNGYHGWRAQYDARGNTTSVTYLGLDAQPSLLPAGYATNKLTFDSHDRQTKQSYYGVKGEAVLHKDGNHGWEVQYDERGNQIALTYFGLDGKPVITSSGYAVKRSVYDSDGNETETSYRDVTGKPTVDQELGVFRIVRTFDGRGKVIEGRYYGEDGKPVMGKNGYHGWKAEYDERGNNTVAAYLGMDGKLMKLADGYATIRSKYDARGKETELAYFDVDNKPVKSKEGLARRTSKYDERGNEIERAFFDVNNKPVALSKGYASYTKKYDERRNEIEEAYFGVDGKPALTDEGLARATYKYNDRDKEIERAFFDANNKPVALKEGYASFTKKYDERGNEIEHVYFDINGKPTLTDEGLARATYTYDERGNEIERAFFDVNNKPVASNVGYAIFTKKYDERGNEIERAFFDVNRRPVALKKGYASFTEKYNDRGKEIEEAYFGADGKPVLTDEGLARVTYKYDERGNEIERSFFDVDGKRILLPTGYAISRWEYDARGNNISMTLYGTREEPVVHKEGYHGWKQRYDEAGNKIDRYDIDLAGNRIGWASVQVKSSDNTFGFALPTGWKESSDLDKSSSLQAMNDNNDEFLLVYSEAKGGSGDTTLEKRHQAVRDSMLGVMENSVASDIQSLTIGGHPALQNELSGIRNGNNLVFLQTTIDDGSHFHKVLAGTTKLRWPALAQELRDITNTFHNIPARTADSRLQDEKYRLVAGRSASGGP